MGKRVSAYLVLGDPAVKLTIHVEFQRERWLLYL